MDGGRKLGWAWALASEPRPRALMKPRSRSAPLDTQPASVPACCTGSHRARNSCNLCPHETRFIKPVPGACRQRSGRHLIPVALAALVSVSREVVMVLATSHRPPPSSGREGCNGSLATFCFHLGLVKAGDARSCPASIGTDFDRPVFRRSIVFVPAHARPGVGRFHFHGHRLNRRKVFFWLTRICLVPIGSGGGVFQKNEKKKISRRAYRSPTLATRARVRLVSTFNQLKPVVGREVYRDASLALAVLV